MNWECFLELQQSNYDPPIGGKRFDGKDSSDGGYTTLFAGEDPRFSGSVVKADFSIRV
jgi:hypothetical protein